MRDKCTGVFGWLFGHKYRARFTTTQRSILENPREMEGYGICEVLEAAKLNDRRYKREVCERCGDTIEVVYDATCGSMPNPGFNKETAQPPLVKP